MRFFTDPTLVKCALKYYLGVSGAGAALIGSAFATGAATNGKNNKEILSAAKEGAMVGGGLVVGPLMIAKALLAENENSTSHRPR